MLVDRYKNLAAHIGGVMARRSPYGFSYAAFETVLPAGRELSCEPKLGGQIFNSLPLTVPLCLDGNPEPIGTIAGYIDVNRGIGFRSMEYDCPPEWRGTALAKYMVSRLIMALAGKVDFVSTCGLKNPAPFADMGFIFLDPENFSRKLERMAMAEIRAESEITLDAAKAYPPGYVLAVADYTCANARRNLSQKLHVNLG